MIGASEGPLLTLFAAVVRHGSFSGAARELKVSKSVISERVALLEHRCGTRLLERTTRRMRLTDAGAEVLEAATRVEDVLAQLSRSLDSRQGEPSGSLTVSTTIDLGALLVGPAVARVVSAWPKVRVKIIAEDAPRDIMEAKVDVAVRMGVPKSSSFVARKLALLREPIVAAPSIAVSIGKATRPRDLAGVPWVRHSLISGATMRFTGPGGAEEEIGPDYRAEANTGSTLLSLLLSGAGVGVLPEHALREHLHGGRLVVLCSGWVWKTVTLYALTPSAASQSAAAKALLSALRDQIARDRMLWGSGG